MKCQDFREIVDSYLCDELLTETNHEVLRHLEMCADCRGEIQERRILREKLKSAVKNAELFQMRDEFRQELVVSLRQHSKTLASPNMFSRINQNSWMAVAAGLILTFGLGLWFLQNPAVNPSQEIAGVNETANRVSLEHIALGDHRHCAVEFNLAEDPVDFDLASAKYANLKQLVNPLQNSADKYEFYESHTCKYQERLFTHIVFQHQGKMISVLLTDLQNFGGLQEDEMIKTSEGNYQIARFDMKNQAVFVVSDLSEQENSATAKLLESSARQHLSVNKRAEPNSFISLKITH